jgi:hypothetical protein
LLFSAQDSGTFTLNTESKPELNFVFKKVCGQMEKNVPWLHLNARNRERKEISQSLLYLVVQNITFLKIMVKINSSVDLNETCVQKDLFSSVDSLH